MVHEHDREHRLGDRCRADPHARIVAAGRLDRGGPPLPVDRPARHADARGGLERDADDTLSFEMDRLHRSCRRLIWLNPLLRFEGFEPRAKGVRTILPHVDELRPIHNLDAMSDLVRALAGAPVKGHDPKEMLRSVA